MTKGLGFKAVTNQVVKVKTSSHKIYMTLTLSKKISQISLGAECQSRTGDSYVLARHKSSSFLQWTDFGSEAEVKATSSWRTKSCLCWSITVGGGGGDLVTKSCLTLAAPWTVACQAPLSMGLSKQEYRNGFAIFFSKNLPNSGLNPGLLQSRRILYGLSYEGSQLQLVLIFNLSEPISVHSIS